MNETPSRSKEARLAACRSHRLREAYKAYKASPTHETADSFYKRGTLVYQDFTLQPTQLDPSASQVFDTWKEMFAPRFAHSKLRENSILTISSSTKEGKLIHQRFKWYTNLLIKTYNEYINLPNDADAHTRNKVTLRFIEAGQEIDKKYKAGDGLYLSNEEFDAYCTYQNFCKYNKEFYKARQENGHPTYRYSNDMSSLRKSHLELSQDPTEPKKLKRFLHYAAKIYLGKREGCFIAPDVQAMLDEFETIIITDPQVPERNGRGQALFRLPDEDLNEIKEKHNPSAETEDRNKRTKRRRDYRSTELSKFADAADFYDFYVTSEDSAENLVWREYPQIQQEAVTILRTAGDAVREYLEKHRSESVPPELIQFYSIYLTLPPLVTETEKPASGNSNSSEITTA
jgi:hypothetical protein